MPSIKTIILTGTLTGGMASDVFNILYRIDPGRMVAQGSEYGDAGIRSFTETYGVLETITTIEPEENTCSEAKVTRRAKERPGASPLLFARFLMDLGTFVSLEDISANLPPFTEEVVSVPMDEPLAEAYESPEKDIAEALQEHRGNSSVVSTALNSLMLYPDRPFRILDRGTWQCGRRPCDLPRPRSAGEQRSRPDIGRYFAGRLRVPLAF